MKQMSDHDLLIRIDERVEKLTRCMRNHLRHHWAITLTAFTAMLAAATSIVITLVMGGL